LAATTNLRAVISTLLSPTNVIVPFTALASALTHFDAFHIGLSATPAAYIDRNTYQFYQCKTGQPDFTFSIAQPLSRDTLFLTASPNESRKS